MSDKVSSCNVCQQPAGQKCGGCHQIYYCSKEHQRSDWKNHKKTCKPYQISEDDVLGRHLVATRAIKPGEVILREFPLVWGPSQITIPVCLGCGKGLNERNSKPCQKCGWPMCSEICQNSPSHLPECSYTANRGDKVTIAVFDIPNPSYQCITALRCLYHKQFLPNIWKKISLLQSHCDERKKSGKYEADRVAVAAFIRRFFKLDSFSEEEILRISGIIAINGHEVPISDPPHVAVYETTSMLEHSCKANCSKTFTTSGEVLVTSGVAIQKGEHLSICYTDPLWGTPNRRHHLYETKYFWCSCPRCLDPTEFETYYSCIKCTDNHCKGLAKPKTFIENTSENSEKSWFCNVCKKEIGAEEVSNLTDSIGRKLQEMLKGNSQACKSFIKNCEKVLAPHHYYITDVKFALSQLLGQEFHGGIPSISDEDLNLKVKVCRDVLELARILAPAENRLRGLLLFELHAAIAEIGRRKGQSGETSPDFLYLALTDSRKYLLEAVDSLKFESELMPEGKICEQARRNLKDIDVLLKTVQCTVGAAPM